MAYTSAQVDWTEGGDTPYMVTFRLGEDVIAQLPAKTAMEGWSIVRSKMSVMRALALGRERASFL